MQSIPLSQLIVGNTYICTASAGEDMGIFKNVCVFRGIVNGVPMFYNDSLRGEYVLSSDVWTFYSA